MASLLRKISFMSAMRYDDRHPSPSATISRSQSATSLPGQHRKLLLSSVKERDVIRVSVLGKPKVGKTTIIRKAMKRNDPAEYDNYIRHIQMMGKDVVIDMQDTQQCVNMSVLEKVALQNADVVLLVFSLTEFDSCQGVVDISLDLEKRGYSLPIIVVANKTDLFIGSRENRAKIETFIRQSLNRPYYEMSAKCDDDDCWNLLKEIYEAYEIERGPYRVTTVAKEGGFGRGLKNSNKKKYNTSRRLTTQ